MNRQVQLLKRGKLYVFEFPLHYNTAICEQIMNLTIDKFIHSSNLNKNKKPIKSILEYKKDAIREVFRSI